MTRFSADKGLVHFTFANEDTYVKKSLIMLDRQQNLYYELRNKNYNAVFFIDLVDNNYRITCSNSAAIELYERYKENGMRGFFGTLFAKIDSNAADEDKSTIYYTMPRDQKENVIGAINRIMTGTSQAAFVFSIKAMASFQGIALAEKVLKKQSLENDLRHNLLLIVSDTHLEDSFDVLTNPDGIFQTEAFPEIRSMCQNYSNVRIYEHMKVEMPDRVTYLNDMEREEICNLTALSILKLGNKLGERLSHLDDYADFLWMMVHSAKFASRIRKSNPELKRIFMPNDKRCFSVLKEALETEIIYEHMDRLIADLRHKNVINGPLLPLIQEDDASAEYQQYIAQNNHILEQIHNLSIRNDSCELNDRVKDKISEMNVKLNHICKELVKPHVVSDKKNHVILQDCINICLDLVVTADIAKNYDTMKIGVEVLYYAICKCEQETKNKLYPGSDDISAQKLYSRQNDMNHENNSMENVSNDKEVGHDLAILKSLVLEFANKSDRDQPVNKNFYGELTTLEALMEQQRRE